jgi:mono/diheme cytochrome c family protein/peroxiredoxin
MRSSLIPLAALFALASPPLKAGPADTASKPVADFALNDLSGKPWSLAGQKDRKAVVVVFLGTEDPTNNAYVPRLVELYREFEPRGVSFVGVNANVHEPAYAVAAHARQYGIPFPILKDAAGVAVDALGARRTPEVFLLDEGHRVLYQGRVDDQYGVGFKRTLPTRRDLAEAIEQVLAGKPVTVAKTAAPGSIIDRAANPKAEGPVTYTKQVSRVIQKNCQECHRPGQVGPIALLNYEDALAWSETIREVVTEGRMPPWHADPKHGEFANDRRLTPADRSALLAWIEGGCPKGDDKDLPPERTFPEGWTIGKPDAVYSMQDAFTVPAKAGDRGVEYKYFEVPTNFATDVWVQAAEAKPGNRALVHHIIVFIRPPAGSPDRDKEDHLGDGFLTGYAPGDMPTVYAPGTAKRIPRGSTLVFQMHYTPNGTAGEDRSCVGIIFARTSPRRLARTRGIDQPALQIPAGAKNFEVTSTTTFRREAELIGFMPHMHLRGKDFEYVAVYPGGRKEVLLRVPRYDFAWQSGYRLKKPLKVPAGTRIECTAHFDNSAGNPNNPDPTKPVAWGDQTWEEMMIGFVDYAYTSARTR